MACFSCNSKKNSTFVLEYNLINLQKPVKYSMIKRFLMTLLWSMLLLPAIAQGDGNKAIFTKPKFSGFAMASYQATFQDGGNSNTFDLRLVRASVEAGGLLHGVAETGLLPREVGPVQAPVHL